MTTASSPRKNIWHYQCGIGYCSWVTSKENRGIHPYKNAVKCNIQLQRVKLRGGGLHGCVLEKQL